MTTIKVSNFVFVDDGGTLPASKKGGTSTGTSGSNYHLEAKREMKFELPDDTRERGLLTLNFDTMKGDDDGIDVAFKFGVNGKTAGSYKFKGDVYLGGTYQVHNLKPGVNTVFVEVTKAGKVTIPDPDEYLGGKGKVSFENISILHHRDVVI